MYTVIISFIVFIFSAFIFHKWLQESKEKLSVLQGYEGANWSAMYFDIVTQLRILKAILQGGTAMERKLKIIFLIQISAFLILFTSMSYFLLS